MHDQSHEAEPVRDCPECQAEGRVPMQRAPDRVEKLGGFKNDDGVVFTSRGVEYGGLVVGEPSDGRYQILVTSREGDEIEPYRVKVSAHRMQRL